MARRKGRELEELVAALEAALAQSNLKVQSPEYVTGRHSGKRCEVDVSIRGKIGSTTIFLMIECRDRRDTEGVDWIEQVATKRQDVGADKAIVVTSADFSEGAKNMAESLGVGIRTLKQLEEGDTFTWLGYTRVQSSVCRFQVLRVTPGIPDLLAETLAEIPSLLGTHVHEVRLRGPAGAPYASVGDVVEALHTFTSMWDDVPGDGTRVITIKKLRLDGYELEATSGWITIEGIAFRLVLWIETEELPASRKSEYQDPQGGLDAVGRI